MPSETLPGIVNLVPGEGGWSLNQRPESSDSDTRHLRPGPERHCQPKRGSSEAGSLGGSTALAASAVKIGAVLAAAGPPTLAIGAGVLLGVGINKIPGVSETLTFEPATDLLSDAIILMGNSPRGGRGRIQTGEDALDQLEGVQGAQDAGRQGKGPRIDSVEKSKQRLQDFLDKINTLEDAEAEFPSSEEEGEDQDGEIRPPG